MRVRVRHPAPVRFLTPRGTERIAHVGQLTEAEIPEVPRGAFEPLPEAVCLCACHRRGDELWASLRHGGLAVAPATLAGWLRGEAVEHGIDAMLTARLRRSPLVAAVEDGVGFLDRVPLTVRAGDGPPRARAILHDAGEAAAAALRRFLREELVLLDGREPLMRVRPLAVFDPAAPGFAARLDLFADGDPHPWRGTAVAPSGLAAAARAFGVAEPPQDRQLAALLRMAPGVAADADAARWLALTRMARLGLALRHAARDVPVPADLLAATARLSDLAAIGTFDADGPGAALERLRAAAGWVRDNAEAYRFGEGRHLRGIALGVLAHPVMEAALPAEDADGIGRLAP